MSASSRAARRAVAINPFAASRTALRPGLGLSASHIGRYTRNLPANTHALAILVPLRNISTERHSTGPPDGPPPGFNAAEAKKPLPKDPKDKAPAKRAAEAGSASKQIDHSADSRTAAPPKEKPTGEAKTLTALAAKKEMEAIQKEEKQGKKLTLGQRVKHEIQHYWDGTKLLATEVKISTRLAVKMAAGYELTRRESRQLQRTVQDLGRLVPFSAFIIVPFAEALLPIALKLFPNLLPSTYESQKDKDKKAATLRATRKEVSSFLRTTLGETGLPLTQSTAQKEEFAIFFKKLRATGEKPTAEDVIKVCKIFRDDLTLDNLSRPQLVSMCRYMNLNTFGTDMMLRYQVRHRMRQIKRDDKAISYEGVDSLSVSELQMACGSRGIKTHGVSPARLRDDLQGWLDVRLKHGVPSTLLVLSNAYMYSQKTEEGGFNAQIDALTGVLSSIPEELYHEIELEVHNAEGAATNKQRLEVLREQQELIDEENEQNQENQETGMATPRDVDDIDEKEERQMQAEKQDAAKAQVSEVAGAEAAQADANGHSQEKKMEAKKNE
ncbi:LETM1-like protein-domain-containing protein [Pseudomassariella vexata]|uniref:LETM1-like protein-domain-containing protein n=1 Tax=Pseudomassariella vexata TaxID=1141098 RepID=A0A1Y2D8P2_9PEZI|nr:LETM1-like protein-domain-containing protein [Pseudomassariella vexata]ORY55496.1 LETM1-like protein-domain-containing protein [Pseudomassariella vexata]